MLLPGVHMEGITVTDEEIREVIEHTPISVLDNLISEYVHDERNQDIARRKIIKNEKFEPISASYELTSKQCRNIVKKIRRIIYEHL